MWNYQKPKKSKSSITKNNPSPFHMKRVDAQLTPIEDAEEIVLNQEKKPFLNLRILLNDITANGLYGFSQDKMATGSLVKLTLLYKKPFFCKAKIVNCRDFISDFTVISEEEKFKYRVTLEFYFENDIEKQRIKNFVKDLQSEEIIRKAK